MNITLNGERRDVTPDTTVRALIRSLGVKPELTAVQLNEIILDKRDFDVTVLADGDVVEIIRIVGGG